MSFFFKKLGLTLTENKKQNKTKKNHTNSGKMEINKGTIKKKNVMLFIFYEIDIIKMKKKLCKTKNKK